MPSPDESNYQEREMSESLLKSLKAKICRTAYFWKDRVDKHIPRQNMPPEHGELENIKADAEVLLHFGTFKHRLDLKSALQDWAANYPEQSIRTYLGDIIDSVYGAEPSSGRKTLL